MSSSPFAGIDTWIFDLDNTLYPADCQLFAQIDQRMSAFIREHLDCSPEQARFLQKDWYQRHGTTLAGLMIEHEVPPGDFLEYVHDIDLSPIPENSGLRAAIGALEGRKYIFTNGSRRHAENVTAKLGIGDLFHDMFDIEAGDYLPKPHAGAYDLFVGRFGISPRRSAFFEDIHQNLLVPFDAGMTTVLVQCDAAWFEDEPGDKRPARRGETFPHVHHVTDDLTGFLHDITRRSSDANEDHT